MTGDELFENLGRVRATDSVVARIQELVLENRLRVGDTLPSERDLAAQFNVSRNVLREALGVLAEKGLITIRPGKGTTIAEPSPHTMRDSLGLLLRLRHVSLGELCDARLLIEPELAARAAERAVGADLALLGDWFRRLVSSADEPAAHVAADLGFHGEIASLAQHAVFSIIVEAVHEPVASSMTFGTLIPRAIDHSDEQHEAIFDAIVAGNPSRARAAMTTHLEYVSGYVRNNHLALVPMRRRGSRG